MEGGGRGGCCVVGGSKEIKRIRTRETAFICLSLLSPHIRTSNAGNSQRIIGLFFGEPFKCAFSENIKSETVNVP